jgi:hypothetical protein
MNTYGNLFAAESFVWPLCLTLIILVVLRKVEAQLSPIVIAMTQGVAGQAKNRATDYAKAMMFGLSASLAAFYDLFSQLDVSSFHHMSLHQYLALWAKVANPFVVAVLAYATQSGATPSKTPTVSTPPFPPSNQ